MMVYIKPKLVVLYLVVGRFCE